MNGATDPRMPRHRAGRFRCLLLLCLAAVGSGCGGEAGLWLRVEAPLLVPEMADAVQVELRTGADETVFDRSYPLEGQQFPHTLMLLTEERALRDGEPLTVRVSAFKGATLSREWSTASAEVRLRDGKTTELTLQMCDCPEE